MIRTIMRFAFFLMIAYTPMVPAQADESCNFAIVLEPPRGEKQITVFMWSRAPRDYLPNLAMERQEVCRIPVDASYDFEEDTLTCALSSAAQKNIKNKINARFSSLSYWVEVRTDGNCRYQREVIIDVCSDLDHIYITSASASC